VNAEKYLHSTAAQAAQIATQAKVSGLALVHISPRYTVTEQHEKEAQAIFPQSFVPNDLECLELIPAK
jgi:ribonuclease Z